MSKKTSIPKEVRQAERARIKAKKAFDKFLDMSQNPLVKQYMEKLDESRKPVLTEVEKRRKETVMLCGMFFKNYYRIDEYVRILTTLSKYEGGEEEASLDDIGGLLNQMEKWKWNIYVIALRAFKMLGVINDNEIDESGEIEENDAFCVFRNELTRSVGDESPWFDSIKTGIRFISDKPSEEKTA